MKFETSLLVAMLVTAVAVVPTSSAQAQPSDGYFQLDQGDIAAHRRTYNHLPSSRILSHLQGQAGLRIEAAPAEVVSIQNQNPAGIAVSGSSYNSVLVSLGLFNRFDLGAGVRLGTEYDLNLFDQNGGGTSFVSKDRDDEVDDFALETDFRWLIFSQESADHPSGLSVMTRVVVIAREDDADVRVQGVVDYAINSGTRVGLMGEWRLANDLDSGIFGVAGEVEVFRSIRVVPELLWRFRPSTDTPPFFADLSTFQGTVSLRYILDDIFGVQLGVSFDRVWSQFIDSTGRTTEWTIWNPTALFGLTLSAPRPDDDF